MLTAGPENGPELCLNIWWFVLEGTDWLDQWAVRAYMLAGSDDDKVAILRSLAYYDFVAVEWQPVPQQYVLVNPSGEEATGVSTLSILREDQSFFRNVILSFLQRTMNYRNLITTDDSGEPIQLEISDTPLQVDTVVVQSRQGRVYANR